MSRELRQSTSVDVPIGPFLDPTDGVTPETTLTITQPDVRLKKNGGNWAQKNAAQTLSHEENGFYEVTLDATDTNTLGLLRLAVFESGSAPVWEDFEVVSQQYWDAKYSTGAFTANVTQWSGGAVPSPVTTGTPLVDVTHWKNDAVPTPTNSGTPHVRVTAMNADTVTSAALATSAVDEIVDAVWDEDATGHQTAGTFGEMIGDPAAAETTIPNALQVISAKIGTPATDLLGDLSAEINDVPAAVAAVAVDGTTTLAESLRLSNSALGGKLSGAGTGTEVARDLADSKDRITWVVDTDGNRSAVTRDLS